MKTPAVLILVFTAGAAGFLAGRNLAPRTAPPPVSTAAASSSQSTPTNNNVSTVTKPLDATAGASASETKETVAQAKSWNLPSELSAEWVQTARSVDRRYGVLYRICSLNPVEHRLVRQLLTRESLLQARQAELRKQGIAPEAIEAALAPDAAALAVLQQKLDREMPEVSQYIAEFKARPVAAAATSEIADRIMIETGALSPTQMEAIFSAASLSEIEHPIPAFVNSLSFENHEPAAVTAAAKSLQERNRKFIPEVCRVLDPAQVSAFMSYLEEQLLALRTGGSSS